MSEKKDTPPTDENNSNTTPVSTLSSTSIKQSSIKRTCRRRPADKDNKQLTAKKQLFKFENKPYDKPVKKVAEKVEELIADDIAVPLNKVKIVEQVMRQRRLRI